MPIDPDIPPVLDELEARVGARVDLVNNRVDENSRQLANLGAAINALHAADKGHDRQIADLLARVAALETAPPPEPEPEPEPVGQRTWFGWNDRGISYTNTVDAGMELGVVRVFNGPNDYTIGAHQNGGTHPVWFSFKPPLTSLENPSSWAPTMMAELKRKFAKGRPVFVCVWHEPEGNRPSGYTVERYVRAWQTANGAMYDLCIEARAEGWSFWTAPVICDWTFTDRSKGAAEQWYSADWDKYDVMGYDVYPVGPTARGNRRICRLDTSGDFEVTPYADPDRRDTYVYVQKCAELAAARGKPWGSAECGILASKDFGGDTLHRFTMEQRAQRYVEIREHLASLENPPLLWTWWINNNAKVHGWNPPDTAGMAALNDSITGNGPVDQLKELLP